MAAVCPRCHQAHVSWSELQQLYEAVNVDRTTEINYNEVSALPNSSSCLVSRRSSETGGEDLGKGMTMLCCSTEGGGYAHTSVIFINRVHLSATCCTNAS